MSDRAFVDTNMLVYAHDSTAGSKHEKARALVEQLWADRSGVLSTQVLWRSCTPRICRPDKRTVLYASSIR